jgi:zinc/manganese transport system permease protein
MTIESLLLLTPAFCAGVLILGTHIPLGTHVLKKGIIFIDVAIAQLAATGFLLAHWAGFEDQVWLLQLGALCCALLGAGIFSLTERWFADIQEAIIGVTFVAIATLDILILSKDAHGGEALTQLLAGQLLWITYPQLLSVAIGSAIILSLYRPLLRLGRLGFYTLFALAITLSVQWLGVYLVFASLIIPALCSRQAKNPWRMICAFIIGILGYASGLIASMIWDLPSGPCVVWGQLLIGISIAAMIYFRGNHSAKNHAS